MKPHNKGILAAALFLGAVSATMAGESAFLQLAAGGHGDIKVPVPVMEKDTQAKSAVGKKQVLLSLRTEDGGAAELVGTVSVGDPGLVIFGNLRVRMNGREYRIGSGSVYLEEICRPYAAKYPYTYERVEGKGVFERSVFIGRDRKVSTKPYHGDDVVVWDGACQREQY